MACHLVTYTYTYTYTIFCKSPYTIIVSVLNLHRVINIINGDSVDRLGLVFVWTVTVSLSMHRVLLLSYHWGACGVQYSVFLRV
jgi:hypothetical protein